MKLWKLGWMARSVIVALLAAGLLLAVATWRRTEAFARMKGEIDAMGKAVAAESGKRPVLVGEPIPGNAWDHYSKALALVPPDPNEPGALGAGPGSFDRKFAELEEHVLRGTRCEDGHYPYDWTQPELTYPDAKACVGLATLIQVRAAVAISQGKAREAIDWLLRACQLLRDLGHNGVGETEQYSSQGLARCALDFASLIKSGKLGKDDLRYLAGKLEQLDGMLPRWSRAMRNHSLREGYSMLRALAGTGSKFITSSREAGWRYLFSTTLVAADAWDWAATTAHVFESAPNRPWPESEARMDEQRTALGMSPNPMLQELQGLALNGGVVVVRALAMFRVLRVSLAYHDTGKTLALEDPFGTTIRWNDPPTRVWSIGPDARDDGGKGGFSLSSTPDIVLDLQ